MALIEMQDFEAMSEGQSLATLNSNWSLVSGSGVALADAAAHGQRGARISGGGIQYTHDAPLGGMTIYSTYMRITQGGTSSNWLMWAQPGPVAILMLLADNRLRLTNGFGNIYDSEEALELGVWYRVEWGLTSGVQVLYVYEGESKDALILGSGALSTYAHDEFVWNAAPGGHSLDLDTIRIGDSWFDPYEDEPPASHPYARLLTGGGWTDLSHPQAVA